MLDVSLQTTWFPIIEAERATHLVWIQNHQNRTKFKEEFLNFIDKGELKTV